MVTRNSLFDLHQMQDSKVHIVDVASTPSTIPEFWQVAPWATGTVAQPLALRAAAVRLNAQIQETNLPIVQMFNAPLFAGQRHFPVPDKAREWYCMPLAEDPLWHSDEGLPLPEEVLARLEAMEATGIEFDTYFIAHELPAEEQNAPTVTLARLQPQPSAAARRASAEMGALAGQLLNLARLPLTAATAGLAAGATLGAAVATGGLGLLAGLDPILMGVLVDPDHSLKPGAPASWYYIAHWIYT